MTDFSKLYDFSTKYKAFLNTADRDGIRILEEELIADYNPFVKAIFEDYEKSVLGGGSKDLCFEMGTPLSTFGVDASKLITDAMEYWGIEEFAFFTSWSSAFSDLKSICDAGWDIAGMCEVYDDRVVGGKKACVLMKKRA